MLGTLGDLIQEVATGILAMRTKNLDGEGNEIFTEDHPGMMKPTGSIVREKQAENLSVPANSNTFLTKFQPKGKEINFNITWDETLDWRFRVYTYSSSGTILSSAWIDKEYTDDRNVIIDRKKVDIYEMEIRIYNESNDDREIEVIDVLHYT